MAVWSQEDFLTQADKLGGSTYARAHSQFLSALRHGGTPPTFDGAGERQATYTVRAAPGAHWHILRVYSNGYVILMLNHLRQYVDPSSADFAAKCFARHLRSDARNSPYLAHDLDEFSGMDFDGVVHATKEVADAVRK